MNNFIYFLENNFFAEELVDLYNEYADYIRLERINNIENINESLAGLKPNDIINMVVYGEYNPVDDYYIFDGYGNIQTINEKGDHTRSELEQLGRLLQCSFYTFLEFSLFSEYMVNLY